MRRDFALFRHLSAPLVVLPACPHLFGPNEKEKVARRRPCNVYIYIYIYIQHHPIMGGRNNKKYTAKQAKTYNTRRVQSSLTIRQMMLEIVL